MPNWNEVLEEIKQTVTNASQQMQGALDTIRRKYLRELHNYTKRNVNAYSLKLISIKMAPSGLLPSIFLHI